jgi:hypothetical protein
MKLWRIFLFATEWGGHIGGSASVISVLDFWFFFQLILCEQREVAVNSMTYSK